MMGIPEAFLTFPFLSCADVTYMIHFYFARMNGLPQLVGGFTTAVSKNDMFNFFNSQRISLRLFFGGK